MIHVFVTLERAADLELAACDELASAYWCLRRVHLEHAAWVANITCLFFEIAAAAHSNSECACLSIDIACR